MIKALVLLSASLLLTSPALAADAAAGKKLAGEACADCHGDNGKGDADNPSIAGMAPAEFTKAMAEYKASVRTKSKKMIKSANKVSDEEVANLAEYYASLPK